MPLMVNGDERETYHIMSVRSTVDKMHHLSLCSINQHVEALSEAQLSHNIVGHEAQPAVESAHDLAALGAILIVQQGSSFLSTLAKNRTQLIDVEEHDIFHAFQCRVGKRLTKNSPLAAMDKLIDHVVRVVHALDCRKPIVKIGLLEPFPMAVDVMESLHRVDRNEVWRHTHVRAISLMQLMKPEMAVTLESVV